MLGHEHRVREVVKRRHARPDQLIGRMFGPQRTKQHVDGIGIRRRERRGECACDVAPTVEEFECAESVRRAPDERLAREGRMHRRDLGREIPHALGGEEDLEGIGHWLPALVSEGWDTMEAYAGVKAV